ncbi:hypothetical protein [Ferrimonas senticii]|uniref:hypothetical protein n=1 Tax=Ferrimonas senticii TaxID=394566 RepID=UPI0003F5D1EA|nr:hypothetical protein [Ferrimonas senticii]
MTAVWVFLKALLLDSGRICRNLFRVMIPALVVIKICEMLGLIQLLSQWLAPLMAMLDLPAEMGLVWATTLVTNTYAGMVVLVNSGVSLTVAQMTTLFALMLVAHGVPVEGAIARRVGMSWRAILLSRLGGGLMLAWLTARFYQLTGDGQQLAQLVWQAQPQPQTLWQWLLLQTQNLAQIALIVFVVMLVLRLLTRLGIEKLLSLLLSPLLRLMGIGKQAASLAIVGITVGLAYGGGLLLEQARAGQIAKVDLFRVVLLLNLLHGVIEDMLLVAFTGADIGYLFWSRLLFAIAATAIVSQLLALTSERFTERWCYRSVAS